MAKHIWHTTQGHGRDSDQGLVILLLVTLLGISIICKIQSLLLKILKLLKYLMVVL